MEEEPNQCENCGEFECVTHLDEDGICEECQPAVADWNEHPDHFTARMMRAARRAEEAEYDPGHP